MEGLIRLLSALPPAFWTAAGAAYLVYFVRQDAGAARWAPRLGWLAAGVHVAAVCAPSAMGRCPMLLGGSVVSGLGLAVGLVHLFVEGRAGDRAIGVFPMALAALFSVLGQHEDPLRQPIPELPAATTAVHVTGGILSYAGVLLAALFGALFLVQRDALKRHRFGLFWERLPSLELLDQFSRRSLYAAAVFLTLTIGFGHVVRSQTGRVEGYWDPKILATNLLWAVAVIVTLARMTNRMRPKVSAIACLGLLVLTLANLLVVDIFSHVHRGI